MSASADEIARQRLLGGNVALDFVNTRLAERRGEPFDCVCSYEDLVVWGRHAGLLSKADASELVEAAETRRGEADATFARAVELREAMEQGFRSLAQGTDPPPEALARLADAQSEALAHGRLVRTEEGFSWRWDQDEDLARMLWPVVQAAVELLTSGDLERVKDCPECHWVFYDASKNRSRRWCMMEDGCGEAVKMRRYVQRRARQRGSRSAK